MHAMRPLVLPCLCLCLLLGACSKDKKKQGAGEDPLPRAAEEVDGGAASHEVAAANQGKVAMPTVKTEPMASPPVVPDSSFWSWLPFREPEPELPPLVTPPDDELRGDFEPAKTVPSFNAQRVPSSKRSEEVVARVAPWLIPALEAKGLRYGSPIFIRIFKEERLLELWVAKDSTYELFRSYGVAAMSGNLGPKTREGDLQAPEGFYEVPPGMMNPNSSYHLSFNVGYPNAYDRAKSCTGSAIMVHGRQASIGCFAMTDPRIEQIYTLVEAALRKGQRSVPVHIFPFRMTEENLQRHAASEFSEFWKELKPGYERFETSQVVPKVTVKRGRYVVE